MTMRHLIERIGNAMEPERRAAVVEAEEGADLTQEVFDAIDWDPLEKEIAKMLGVGAGRIKLKGEMKQYRHRGATQFVELHSDNLVGDAGVFRAVFLKVAVQVDGTYFPKENGISLMADLRWEHKSGGSNGTGMLRAMVDLANKKWQFQENFR